MSASAPIGFGVPSFRVGMDIAGYLRNPFLSIDDQMRLIDGIQRFAEARLFAACKRIRIPIDDVADDVDRTLTTYWSVKEAPKASVGDLQACELFEACVDVLGRRRLDQYGRDRIVGAFIGLGNKFNRGRMLGSVGPVRKAIQKVLKRKPGASAAEVWTAIKAKAPKDMEFCDNSLGKYIELGNGKTTGYDRFANIVTLEKNPK